MKKINPEWEFENVAREYGWQSSTYSAILQFSPNELTSAIILPHIELLPGYAMGTAAHGANARFRLCKFRRLPMQYKLKIWFAGYGNYAFNFKATTEQQSLAGILYEVCLNGYQDKRKDQIPQEPKHLNKDWHPNAAASTATSPTIITTSAENTRYLIREVVNHDIRNVPLMDLLEEIERRYKTQMPDWGDKLRPEPAKVLPFKDIA